MDLRARQELLHDWLYIEHGTSFDRIELSDVQSIPLTSDHLADRATDAIRSFLPSLSKYSDCGPDMIVAWMSCSGDHTFGFYAIEEEQDLDV